MTIDKLLEEAKCDTSQTDFTKKELRALSRLNGAPILYERFMKNDKLKHADFTNPDTSSFTKAAEENLNIELSRDLTLDELYSVTIAHWSVASIVNILKKMNALFLPEYSDTLFSDIPLSDEVVLMRTETFVLIAMTLISRNTSKNTNPRMNSYYGEIMTPDLLKLTAIDNAVSNRYSSSQTMTAISFLINRFQSDKEDLARLIADGKLLELTQSAFKSKSRQFSNKRLVNLFVKNVMNVNNDEIDYTMKNLSSRSLLLAARLSRNEYTIETINEAIESSTIEEMREVLAIN